MDRFVDLIQHFGDEYFSYLWFLTWRDIIIGVVLLGPLYLLILGLSSWIIYKVISRNKEK